MSISTVTSSASARPPVLSHSVTLPSNTVSPAAASILGRQSLQVVGTQQTLVGQGQPIAQSSRPSSVVATPLISAVSSTRNIEVGSTGTLQGTAGSLNGDHQASWRQRV